MLHLILGILKVIGILLLAVIGLIVLILLTVLFVPVRYQLAGKKTEDILEGRIAVSWLLHLVSVIAEYREKQLGIRIKLFGITIKRIGGGQEKTEKKSKPGRKKAGKRKKQKTTEETEKTDKIEKTDKTDKIEIRETGENTSEGQDTAEKSAKREDIEEQPAVKRRVTVEQAAEKAAETARTVKSGKEEAENREIEEKTAAEEAASGRRLTDRLRRILGLLVRIWEFVLSIPEKILNLSDKISEAFSSGENALERIGEKKEEILRQIRPYFQESSIALYKRILGHLKYLWKSYRPRKMQGWMRFGTGAPDLTGELTGLFYLLLPVSAQDFELIPEFTEVVFQADILLKGHIRSCCMVRVAFLLWRDKEFRKMIRKVRAKGGK